MECTYPGEGRLMEVEPLHMHSRLVLTVALPNGTRFSLTEAAHLLIALLVWMVTLRTVSLAEIPAVMGAGWKVFSNSTETLVLSTLVTSAEAMTIVTVQILRRILAMRISLRKCMQNVRLWSPPSNSSKVL